MSDNQNKSMYDYLYLNNGTQFYMDFTYSFPVVHEHRIDGTVITHVRPSGSKSTFTIEAFQRLLNVERERNSDMVVESKHNVSQQKTKPYYQRFNKRKF